MRITLNGDPFDLDEPLSVTDLLARLGIDPRRVAVEHNLAILRRDAFAHVVVREGDQIEIVNFVGGGAASRGPRSAIRDPRSAIRHL